MKNDYLFIKLFIFLLFSSCQGEISISKPLEDLLYNVAPVLDDIPDQSATVAGIAITTINSADGGDDLDFDSDTITYSCTFDTTVDGVVSAGANCTTLTGVSFAAITGVMDWIPIISQTEKYEFKIVGSDGSLTDDEIFVIDNSTPRPAGLSLSIPAFSPGLDDTPTVTISGVESDNTVKLFTDNTCTTLVGSGVSSGAIINITSNAISTGTHTFYATTTGFIESLCSVANVDYTLSECPIGYIPVPGNATYGAPNDFCVMKYEAKNDGSNNPTSTAISTPWTNIDQIVAKAECESLNALNGVANKYDLISNPEWMAVGVNVMNIDSNWTSGTVGSGCLKRGNMGGTYPCLGGDSGYNGPDPDFGVVRPDNGTAQLTLDNGEVVWDFSGNVWSWVDWTLGGILYADMEQAFKPYRPTDPGPLSSWLELNEIDNFPNPAVAPEVSMRPIDSDENFNSAHGMGEYFAGASGNGSSRGGDCGWLEYNGVFALYLGAPSTFTHQYVGFRCVFRP